VNDSPGPASPPAANPFVPWTTRITIAVVGVVSVAGFWSRPLVDLLRKDNGALQAGELWRLFTPGLVHGGALHLAMNGIFLLDLGGLVERLFGGRRLSVILWGSVAAGSIASALVNPAPSVGISGGLFGLVGAMLAQGIRYWRRLSPDGRRMFLRGPIEIVILNVAMGYTMPNIDNAAHLGGLAGGLVLGALLGLSGELRARMEGRLPAGRIG
jgi:rhomboid protease GluP